MLKVSTFCSGIGSPEMALKNLGIEHEVVLTAEIDKYARETYLANHSTKKMIKDMTVPDYEGEEWYADINISGLPCQSFSLAGKRLGELDPRGLLFFDFYRYVKNQKPKYFIIENVKGLLSDNDGKTFQNWINLLGQSVNGDQFMFPHEDSLMYNLHWQVLNTKDYGLPQNRERVFLIGIRNDLPNSFVFPKKIPLELRLKDILEDNVDEKYYLSDTHLESMSNWKSFKNPLRDNLYDGSEIMSCLTARGDGEYHSGMKLLKVENVGNTNPSGNGMNGNVFSENGISPTLTTNKGEGIKVQIKSATASGYEIATEGNQRIAGWFENENVIGAYRDDAKRSSVSEHIYQKENSVCNTIQCAHVPKVIQGGKWQVASGECETTSCNQGVMIGAMRGRNPENKSDRTTGAPTQQMLEINENGTSNCLTSVQKDNLVIQINPCLKSGGKQPYQQDRIYDSKGIAPALMRGKSDLNVTEVTIQNNGNETKTNAREILRLLFAEVSKETIKEWRSYVASTLQQNGLLQSGLYEESLFYQSNKNGRYNCSEQQSEGAAVETKRMLRGLWKRECNRCSPHRRESIKQLFRKLTETLPILSCKNTQTEQGMQSDQLQWEAQSLWLLQQALYQVQEIRESNGLLQPSFRIRKLTTREVFRLQGFPDEFHDKAVAAGVSNSQLYKQAGNSISVPVVQAILNNLLKDYLP